MSNIVVYLKENGPPKFKIKLSLYDGEASLFFKDELVASDHFTGGKITGYWNLLAQYKNEIKKDLKLDFNLNSKPAYINLGNYVDENSGITRECLECEILVAQGIKYEMPHSEAREIFDGSSKKKKEVEKQKTVSPTQKFLKKFTPRRPP